MVNVDRFHIGMAETLLQDAEQQDTPPFSLSSAKHQMQRIYSAPTAHCVGRKSCEAKSVRTQSLEITIVQDMEHNFATFPAGRVLCDFDLWSCVLRR